MLEAPTDAELMARTKLGDPDAFGTVVARYKDQLVNYLTHVCGSRDRAEEYAQEAFVRLYQHAHRYDEQGKLAPYLFRIATNLMRSENSRMRRWQRLLLGYTTNGNGQPSPQAVALQREVQTKVSEALAAVPMPYRAALILREVEGWSYDEIAEALGCREGTVKSRIGRGREYLRQSLQPYWNGAGARSTS
jgi:RNA polymerase sigma-70 factor (ECF subfamily)